MTHHDKARELVELLLAYDARTATGRLTHRAADLITAQAEENRRLREALKRIANYREEAHAYDDDMGHLRRCFDIEAVMFMEAIARAALSSTGEKG